MKCVDLIINAFLRKAAMYLAHRYSGRSLGEIGERLSIGESAVSQASKLFETELKNNRASRKRDERTRKVLGLSNV